MQVHFVLGPAGSGKTFRCLAEVRAELASRPDGPPLLFLAPKQATFQLERQLLADPRLPGFTRLRILSFERLARYLLELRQIPEPTLLDEEGRIMVLRSLLTQHQDELHVFRASARTPSFACELSVALRELQRNQCGPERLAGFGSGRGLSGTLSAKLKDLSLLSAAYRKWLNDHALGDVDALIELAASPVRSPESSAADTFSFARLWLDGFAEMTPQEVALLSVVVARCKAATLAFCLEEPPQKTASWLSAWGVIGETFQRCHATVAQHPDVRISTEILSRTERPSRFTASPELSHLEANWAHPRPRAWDGIPVRGQHEFNFHEANPSAAIRLVSCPDPEDEAEAAADRIVEFVRKGGRFRDVAVLVRALEQIPSVFGRTFRRREIPFFLDQRQPAGHHPATEFTRAALRVVAFGWRHDDWFGVLKSGLAGLDELSADRLENFALAEGVEGARWHEPITGSARDLWAEEARGRVTGPFQEFEARLGKSVTGPVLAAAMRELWEKLRLAEELARWDEEAVGAGEAEAHVAVLESLHRCLNDAERAFPDKALPLVEWLAILESAFSGLTVGLVPPALDQVLIGALDRSRNPNLELVILPGWNEGKLPLVAEGRALLSPDERERLAQQGLWLAPGLKARLGHERFLAYIGLTRASRALLVTFARTDSQGVALNPSPFIHRLQRLFPELAPQFRTGLESRSGGPAAEVALAPPPCGAEVLLPEIAACLHGPSLEASVTELEQFAECPFRFFASVALKAKERRLFEFDRREKGTLQHQLLARFHASLQADDRQWRQLSPAEAREKLETIAGEFEREFQRGLVTRRGANNFLFRGVRKRLGDFVAATVGWMAGNQFDPRFVEFSFGTGPKRHAPWTLDLGGGRALRLGGRVDRIDLWRDAATGALWLLLVDYKSGGRKFDEALTRRGAELQLAAYLAALVTLGLTGEFAGQQIQPAGMVYASLRRDSSRAKSRPAPAESGSGSAETFLHRGRLNRDLREILDRLPTGMPTGQFQLGRATKGGGFRRGDAVSPEEIHELLEVVTETLRTNARQILDGLVPARPLQLGSHDACAHCASKPVCRIAGLAV